MPITGGTAGDKLVLRIFKYHAARPDTKWVNNYEFQTNGTWTSSDLIQAAADFTAYEQAFHNETTIFDRWTFSTWAEDSTPYDPTAFMSGAWPATSTGGVPGSTTGDMTPLDLVAWVARQVATGRQGKAFYRNVVGELGVQAPSGVAASQGTYVATKFALGKDLLGGYIPSVDPPEGTPPMALALISKTGQVRLVQDLVVRGVAINKRDRAYFDRI
jgi:hypothetical protein